VTTERRQIGLPAATALVIANMIGTGVFTTSGFLLADLKSPWLVMAGWFCGGLIAMTGALCYGALARRIPESGGEYLFLSKTLHPAIGYVAGWISLLVGFSAPVAAAAMAFGEYIQLWFRPVPAPVLASMPVLVCAAVHAWSVRSGAGIHTVAVAVKLALLLLFFGLASPRLTLPLVPQPIQFDGPQFAVALVWISFSYAGWNAAIYLAGEVRNPDRNVPRAMIIGTAIVTMLYLMLNAVFVFCVPIEQLAGKLEIGLITASHLGGAALAHAVTGMIALALVTCVSALMMAGPRVFAKMAEDGYFPAFFRIHGDTPFWSITLQAVIALALIWTATYKSLLTYIGFTLALTTAVTVLGLILLRLRERLHVPGWPFIPAIFLGAVLWMTIFSIVRQPRETGWGIATIGLILMVWFFNQGRRQSK
jgi:APA family basic amino acid/polyamine antiporter